MCSPAWPGIHYIYQTGVELVLVLVPMPCYVMNCDHRHILVKLSFSVAGGERQSHVAQASLELSLFLLSVPPCLAPSELLVINWCHISDHPSCFACRVNLAPEASLG